MALLALATWRPKPQLPPQSMRIQDRTSSAASSRCRSRTTSSTASASPTATIPTGCASAGCRPRYRSSPDSCARLATFPTFFGEGPASSVTRRVGISIGQNLYTPQQHRYVALRFSNDRPYAAWLYSSFALQQTYKRRDAKTDREEPVRLDTLQLDLGAHRAGRGRRVRAEQFPQADRRADRPTAGPTSCTTSRRSAHLRASLAHRSAV